MNDNRAGALPPHRAESRLIKAASDAVRNHCANPDRTDCPDSEAIHAVVIRRVAYRVSTTPSITLPCARPASTNTTADGGIIGSDVDVDGQLALRRCFFSAFSARIS